MMDDPRGFVGYAPSSRQFGDAPRAPAPPAPPSPFEEREALPEPPPAYASDRVVLLPKDPWTLWLCWDLDPETVRRAREGMRDPSAALRVYRNGAAWRRADVALEQRNHYLRDLEPGQAYRVEVCWVAGPDGDWRIIRSSREVRLPPAGPSARIADRFARIPWGLALAELNLAELEVAAPAGADRREELVGGPPAGYPASSSGR